MRQKGSKLIVLILHSTDGVDQLFEGKVDQLDHGFECRRFVNICGIGFHSSTLSKMLGHCTVTGKVCESTQEHFLIFEIAERFRVGDHERLLIIKHNTAVVELQFVLFVASSIA